MSASISAFSSESFCLVVSTASERSFCFCTSSSVLPGSSFRAVLTSVSLFFVSVSWSFSFLTCASCCWMSTEPKDLYSLSRVLSSADVFWISTVRSACFCLISSVCGAFFNASSSAFSSVSFSFVCWMASANNFCFSARSSVFPGSSFNASFTVFRRSLVVLSCSFSFLTAASCFWISTEPKDLYWDWRFVSDCFVFSISRVRASCCLIVLEFCSPDCSCFKASCSCLSFSFVLSIASARLFCFCTRRSLLPPSNFKSFSTSRRSDWVLRISLLTFLSAAVREVVSAPSWIVMPFMFAKFFSLPSGGVRIIFPHEKRHLPFMASALFQ